MRITTVFRRLVGVTHMVVESLEFDEQGIVLGVHPSWRKPRCGECGHRAPGYDRARKRHWRHLNLGVHRITLEYQPRRVSCRVCGIRTEAMPWAEHGSWFTRDFEELAAYLAQVTDKTQVTRLMGIDWETVGRVVQRVVARKLDTDRFENLRCIGIDEFGYRRRHRYLTVVVDHEKKRVVWGTKGKNAAALEEFFDELGEERCAAIEYASIDMSAGFIKAIRDRLPNAQIVFDRFHVQRLASDAVDEVRREQLRDLRGTDAGTEIF